MPTIKPAHLPRRSRVGRAFLLALFLFSLPAAIQAAEETQATASDDERLDDVEEQVEVLAEELGRLRSIFVVPEEIAYESFSGLGPAASKVYKRDRGLSIGGYGEVRLRKFVDKEDDDEDDIFDALRAVLYTGYKFNENWVVNSELEFEHGGTSGGGSVSLEFLTVDYLWRDEANARVGLLLIPMGFVNEIHEPNFFFGAERPEVERRILPSTWRENGAGLFGTIADVVDYRVYAVNGFDGSGFDSNGLRGGRQKGSEALANDFAFVGRVDVHPAPGLMLGGSLWVGQSGQDQDNTGIDGVTRNLPDALTTVYELHAQYKAHGASLRWLWTEAFVDDAGSLSRSLDKGYSDVPAGSGTRVFTDPSAGIARHMRGWYAEAGYDVIPWLLEESKMSLEPFFRYEFYDTQHDVAGAYTRDRSKKIDLFIGGLQFKPIPQVVFKVDYRHFEPDDGHKANQVQALVGYVF
ncbi:MAG: hypothetical protein JRF61_18580 [Deltaproteobacteria bacterium]|jgi:hypothetical protein|nr:hypothetical protein [Deltaproteobacteria bacterium]